MKNDIDFNLNRTEFPSEKELEEYLLSMSLYYGTKMNEIENYIYKLHDENRENQEIDYFPEFRKLYLPVFEAFATDKKRVYGGKADSFGFPSKYDGIENFIESSVILKNKNRAEVYFKTNNNFDAEYLFVLIRKNDLWRIDNVKYRWYNNKKWSSTIM